MTHYLLMLIQTVCCCQAERGQHSSCSPRSERGITVQRRKFSLPYAKPGSDQCYGTGTVFRSQIATSLTAMPNIYIVLDEYYLMHASQDVKSILYPK